MNEAFRRIASRVAKAVGSPWTFLLSVMLIICWAVSGPIFHYSDTWQLVINTGTTIITFLMVFLIQNTQNRDAKGIHLKLDELIKATVKARNSMIDLDDLTDDQLKSLEDEYKKICGDDRAAVVPQSVAEVATAAHRELEERTAEAGKR